MSLTVPGIHRHRVLLGLLKRIEVLRAQALMSSQNCLRESRCSEYKHLQVDRSVLSEHKSSLIYRKSQISYEFNMLNL